MEEQIQVVNIRVQRNISFLYSFLVRFSPTLGRYFMR